MPLGSLLGPPEALLGGLKSEKMQTVRREKHFFENAAFWFFEAPDGSLGLILLPLWPIWSENGPQKWPPKVVQKVTKKWSKKMIPKMAKKVPILVPKMGPKMGQNRSGRKCLKPFWTWISSWPVQLEKKTNCRPNTFGRTDFWG